MRQNIADQGEVGPLAFTVGIQLVCDLDPQQAIGRRRQDRSDDAGGASSTGIVVSYRTLPSTSIQAPL